MKISQRVIELWRAQDFITMEDNSRTQSDRVDFLVRDTVLNVLYLMMKYHENTLKDFKVMGRTRFKNYGGYLQNGVS